MAFIEHLDNMKPPLLFSETGEYYGTPKEWWGFRTPPSHDSPKTIARRFLKANAERLGLNPRLEGLSRTPKVLTGLGASHVIFRQFYRGYAVHKGFVTVHIDNFGRVYLCKCRAVPENEMPKKDMFRRSKTEIKKVAIQELSKKRTKLRKKSGHKIPPSTIYVHSCIKQWFLNWGVIRPCWRVRVHCTKPKETWTLFFRDDLTRPKMLDYIYGILLAAPAAKSKPKPKTTPKSKPRRRSRRSRENWADGVGLVFSPNPIVSTGSHDDLLEIETRSDVLDGKTVYHSMVKTKTKAPSFSAYRVVRIPDLNPRGKGQLNGKRVDVRVTSGNRVIGEVTKPRKDDLKGSEFRNPTYRFMRFSGDQGFEEVMAYYYVDAAIQWLEKIGYKDRRYIFQTAGTIKELTSTGKLRRLEVPRGKAMQLVVNVYHSHEDDAFYEPITQQLYFGTGQVSELEDAETLLHEFGHALQDFICNGFGFTPQAAAMGEGFSDYFAASFFYDQKPDAWKPTVMSWDGVVIGIEKNENISRSEDDRRAVKFPPCLRRMDEPYTFEDFNEEGDSHHNGEIWSATLWDIRMALGREIADKIIIDSHFELSTHTNFRRGARAILHADDNIYGSVHSEVLLEIFANRGISIFGEIQNV